MPGDPGQENVSVLARLKLRAGRHGCRGRSMAALCCLTVDSYIPC